MKAALGLLTSLMLAASASAEFRVWTRNDGRTAELELSKVEKFHKQFSHPGRGIPNLVLCDLQGKLIKTSCEGEQYIGPTAVMTHLNALLTE